MIYGSNGKLPCKVRKLLLEQSGAINYSKLSANVRSIKTRHCYKT